MNVHCSDEHVAPPGLLDALRSRLSVAAAEGVKALLPLPPTRNAPPRPLAVQSRASSITNSANGREHGVMELHATPRYNVSWGVVDEGEE